MERARGLGDHADGAQLAFEEDLEAAEATGEVQAVVGELTERDSPGSGGFAERAPGRLGRGFGQALDPQRDSGVIIEEAEDLHHAAGDRPVDAVGLPQLVGGRGFEPTPRALRTLARFGDHEPAADQHPPDRRFRRRRQTSLAEMELDGPWAVIDPKIGEFLAESDDRFLDIGPDTLRAGLRSPRTRLEPFDALCPIAAPPHVERLTGDPVLATEGSHVHLLRRDRCSQSNIHRNHPFGHAPPWSPAPSGVRFTG